MKFSTFPLEEAAGTVLAHAVRLPTGLLKKGRVLNADDIAAMRAHGVTSVMAARLGPDDVAEDEAARRIAEACRGDGLQMSASFTGRTNLIAAVDGLAVIARERLIEINSLDEGLTVATVAPFERVEPGQLIATVKVIPFALPATVISAAERILRQDNPVVRIAPFASRGAGLVLTRLPGVKAGLLDKRVKAMRQRLEAMGSRLDHVETVAHDTAAVREAIGRMARAGCDPILLFGASAIVDRGDVIPQALADSGGTIVHLGMPVDPGNLLMVGRLDAAAVVGVPSCATSPKLNGFDWVLARLLAGLPVGRAEIVAMAPGGLLTEIEARPQPRRG